MSFKKFFFLAFFIATLLPSIALSQSAKDQKLISPQYTCAYIKEIYAFSFERHIAFPNVKRGSINKSSNAYDDVAFNEALASLDHSKVFDTWINQLDSSKIYLSKQDVAKMKNIYDEFVANITSLKCGRTFFEMYKVYILAAYKRTNFLMEHISSPDFKFEENSKYIYRYDKVSRAKNETEMEQYLKTYAQSGVVSLLSRAKDFKTSVAQFKYQQSAAYFTKTDWSPFWSQEKRNDCQNKKANYGIAICKPSKWMTDYLNSFLTAHDPNSSFFDEQTSKNALDRFNNTPFVGIGVEIGEDLAGYVTILRVIQDGPAFNSQKIKSGDTIIGVGQSKDKVVDIFGMRIGDVVSIIKGPQGTKVYLNLRRKQEGQTTEFIIEITRNLVKQVKKQIETTFLKWVEVDRGSTKYRVAVIHISSFYNGIAREVKELVQQANEGGAQSMVLDVASNPGGTLQDVVEIVGLFLHKANIVGTIDKSNLHVLVDRSISTLYSGPLVVLTNQRSASASEILAGTLQDYNRAVIVGDDHTYGKGSVQGVLSPVINKVKHIMKITGAIYLTPSSGSPHGKGVPSDIIFPNLITIENSLVLPDNIDILSYDNFLSPRSLTDPDNKIDFIDNEGWIEILSGQSQKRISNSSKFQKIMKTNEKYKKLIADSEKTITIGERLTEQKEYNQKISDQKANDQTVSSKKDNYEDRAQVEEATNIAADLAQIFEIEKILDSPRAYLSPETSNLSRVEAN